MHADHADEGLLRALKEAGVVIYGNTETSEYLSDIVDKVVADGDKFSIGSIDIEAHNLPHCLMVDGSAGPENTGFIFNDRLFHAGDGTEISGVKVDYLMLAITGPDVSMKDAYGLVKSVQAKVAIPMHYDNTRFYPATPEAFEANIARRDKDLKVQALDDGQSLTVD